MTMQPATPESYRLLHEGALELAAIECRGIRIDQGVLRTSALDIEAEIKGIRDWAREQPEWAAQRKRFGQDANLGSREQLAWVMFQAMGHPYKWGTGAKGQYLLGDEVVEDLNQPYTNKLARMLTLDKVVGTYLRPIMRETAPDGRLHAFFNLHKVVTFRSSSDGPNLQNIPVRDKEISKWVRSAFVPDPGCCLVEIDYVAAEVRIAACYHLDPRMIEHIETNYDMHTDAARDCYMIAGPVPKPARQAAKGLFVFAEFYGDYWKSVGAGLWRAAATLPGPDGAASMYAHLASKGLDTEDKYLQHIKRVEHIFWKEKYTVYDAWRVKWWQRYLQRGHFHTLSGFRIWGNFNRNEVINSPVQGTAFHMLLKAIVEITRRCRQAKARSAAVCQVHDSGLFNVPYHELAWFTAMAREVMCVWMREQWRWIVVPLNVEAEASDQNWHSKQAIEIGAEYGHVGS